MLADYILHEMLADSILHEMLAGSILHEMLAGSMLHDMSDDYVTLGDGWLGLGIGKLGRLRAKSIRYRSLQSYWCSMVAILLGMAADGATAISGSSWW